MSNYSLRRSVQSCAVDGKCSRLNRVTDRLLHSIFGDFHWEGPRNWVGSVSEGRWTKRADFDNTHTLIGIIIGSLFLWMAVNTESLEKVGLVYIIMTIWVAIPIWSNKMNPKSMGEYIGLEPRDFKKYATKSVVLAILWSISYILLGSAIYKQQIIGTGIVIMAVNVLMIPWIESIFFAGTMLPTFVRGTGILPGLIMQASFRSVFHWLVFAGNPLHLLMTFVYGIVFGWLALSYKDWGADLSGHIVVNTISQIIR